jgi:hypothetical protein
MLAAIQHIDQRLACFEVGRIIFKQDSSDAAHFVYAAKLSGGSRQYNLLAITESIVAWSGRESFIGLPRYGKSCFI